MKHVQFFWGFEWMFLVGVKYEYKALVVALGPLYLEWYW